MLFLHAAADVIPETDFGGGQFVEDLAHAPIHGNRLRSSRLGVLELKGENGGSNAQELAAVIQVQLPWNVLQESVALGGESPRSRIKGDAVEKVGDALQKRDFLGAEQGIQILEVDGEEREEQLSFRGGPKLRARGGVQDKNVSGLQVL